MEPPKGYANAYHFAVHASNGYGNTGYASVCPQTPPWIGVVEVWEALLDESLIARVCSSWAAFGTAYWDETGKREPHLKQVHLYKEAFGYKDQFVHEAECSKEQNGSLGDPEVVVGSIVWAVGPDGGVATPLTGCNFLVFNQGLPPPENYVGPCATGMEWRSEIKPSLGAQIPWLAEQKSMLESAPPNSLLKITGDSVNNPVVAWCDIARL